MIRVFGRGKPRDLPPTLNDAIELVDKRAEAVERKVDKLDTELRKYKDQMVKMREGAAKDGVKQKAIRVLQQKRLYETQLENLRNQSFNMEQTNSATQSVRDTQTTLRAMRDGVVSMRKEIRRINIDRIDALQDEMAGLLEMHGDIQEAMGRSYETPLIDDDELQMELDALGEEIARENDSSYLDEIMAPPAPGRDPGTSGGSTEEDHGPLDEFGLPRVPLPDRSPLSNNAADTSNFKVSLK